MRRLLIWLVALIVVVAAGGGAYVWLSLNGAFIKKMTPEALLALLEPDILIKKPDGPGPFPAVVLVNGCEGLWVDDEIRPVMPTYADIAVSEGVVAIIIDSFRPRHIDAKTAIDRVCSGWLLRGAERAGDVAVSLSFARDLPFVDTDRLALAGWSHGGWSIMDMLAMLPDRMKPQNLTEWPAETFGGLVGIYLSYPYCGFPALAPSRGFAEPRPAWAIHGTEDQTANPVPCDKAYRRVIEEGAQVLVEIVEGATHAFDRPSLSSDSSSKYDPEGAALAHQWFRGFLRDVLIPGGVE